MKILIADDEGPARARLRQLLANEPQLEVEVIHEACSGDEAVEVALTQRPELLFLDIEMPPTDGLTAFREIRQVWQPKVIFTTAHAASAVDAFDLEATDYLLKPYSRARFAAALERARRPTTNPPFARSNPPPVAPLDRLLIKSGNRHHVVDTQDILSVQAAANYVVLHTTTGKHIMRRTLSQLAEELSPTTFFRTSRSTIANLRAVREVKSTRTGAQLIVLSDGSDLPLTVGLRELESRLHHLR